MQCSVSKWGKNYSLASLTLDFGKIMEQMFHFQKTDDEEMTGNSQHTFIKSKPYLTRLIAFYDEMIGSVDKGEGIDERMQSNLSCL